ncbi:MAG TPA: hypothetical protein VF698_15380, partial [Thermoanaerobaculia bacterium]
MRSALAALLLFAQVQPPLPLPPMGETIEVSVVNVDVYVTDKQGRRVYGLTKDDFEIRENGRTQPITNFAEYRGDAADGTVTVDAAAPQKPADVPRQPRTLAVFIEQFAALPLRRDEF